MPAPFAIAVTGASTDSIEFSSSTRSAVLSSATTIVMSFAQRPHSERLGSSARSCSPERWPLWVASDSCGFGAGETCLPIKSSSFHHLVGQRRHPYP